LALQYAAVLHTSRREVQAIQERAEEVIRLSREQEFLIWLPLGTALQGWALTEQGQIGEGITKLQQGLTAYRATGAELGQPSRLALLAMAHAKAGQAEEGLKVLAEALALVDKNEERTTEAELYRLKGELTLQASIEHREARGKEAETCFHKAMKIARGQQAKSWELRAVVSLACLWQHQGKTAEAHELLSEIYGWFTEGFDTKDLQEAKALLTELAEGV
jgi:predicted ATPase